MDYKELVTYLVAPLVDKPDQIEVHEIEGEKSLILELRVATDDIGKVIGKNGRIAKAIRTLIRATGVRSGRNIQLEIIG